MSDLVGLINLLAPFFGLIGLGFFCGRIVHRPEGGLAWMQFFLIYVSLPCLFYRLIADKSLDQLTNWSFIAITTLTTFCAFVLSYSAGFWHTKDVPQSVMQGVAGSYSNIGYMGPPLILSAMGPAASAPVVLIFVFDNLLLFSLVPFLMAVAGVEKRTFAATARDVAWKVVTHPFNVATAAGILASYVHLQLPEALDKMVGWLSGAAAPCALFLLGVTVALRPRGARPRLHQADPASPTGLDPVVLGRRFRPGLDLYGGHHGRLAAGPEHLRDLDAVQCGGGTRLGLRAPGDGRVHGDAHGLPLAHQDGQDALRPVPVTRLVCRFPSKA
jgi:predicted permease